MVFKNCSEEELLRRLSKLFKQHAAIKTLVDGVKELDKRTKTRIYEALFLMLEVGMDEESIEAYCIHTLTRIGSNSIVADNTNAIAEEVTRIEHIVEANKKRVSVEDMPSVVLAATYDIRALLLWVIDFLADMRASTIKENAEKAEFATKVAAPLCQKLGLWELQWQLEDLALKSIDTRAYYYIKKLVGEKREVRESMAKELEKEMKQLMESADITCWVSARAKSFYSIYRKMKSGRKFNQIYDLLGARIVCENVADCYKALGMVHAKYKYLGIFRDYIAKPKENKYRSLHTVIEWHGRPAEVQIRTWQMHWIAEAGVAAHWRYKKVKEEPLFDSQLSVAKQLIAWQRSWGYEKFFDSLRIAFEQENVLVFTPKYEVIRLPKGATALDFAFAVHSDLGLKCEKIFVNGKIVPLDHELKTGDVVKVVTGSKKTVKHAWLNMIKTHKARVKIKRQLGLKTTSKKGILKKAGSLLVTSSRKVRLARCCNPLPGDRIAAYKTTKNKISVHRANCPNLAKIEKRRFVKIEWGTEHGKYESAIKIVGVNLPGTFNELMLVMRKKRAKIFETQARSKSSGEFECIIKIEAKNLKQLNSLMGELEKVSGIIKVERA
jgi:GTP pyrophosphokinase